VDVYIYQDSGVFRIIIVHTLHYRIKNTKRDNVSCDERNTPSLAMALVLHAIDVNLITLTYTHGISDNVLALSTA